MKCFFCEKGEIEITKSLEGGRIVSCSNATFFGTANSCKSKEYSIDNPECPPDEFLIETWKKLNIIGFNGEDHCFTVQSMSDGTFFYRCTNCEMRTQNFTQTELLKFLLKKVLILTEGKQCFAEGLFLKENGK